MITTLTSLVLQAESTPGIPEVTKALFPNLPNFIAHVLSTIIIILFLAKLVYKPFKKIVAERRKKINELLDDASSKQALANKDKKDAAKLLIQAREESKGIILNAKTEADELKFDIIDNAKKEAQNIQEHAKQAMEFEKNEAQEDIRKEIIDLAFLASQKILAKEVNIDVDKKLIEEFLDKLD
ncbi:F0F1 ATP synthase subunit B [Spiroplasma tabanidicola]|uniref:ATP synthase subunit b n=1 Tax=Spiroplasma tabanidicola TaxID=324079 RepID=A0A6I6CBP1_9MOLU|nr:F0F1 ATP synthase subunit B [Spiroplasma tabanidicola]QGS51502.1 F0F1 ATP synthase subunit B [Spiroplasma tabanidicola]